MATSRITATFAEDQPNKVRRPPLRCRAIGLIGASLLAAAASTAATPRIPLCPGLTIVTAISQSGGDYESIKTVQAMDAKQIRIKYSADVPNSGLLASGPPVRRVDLNRTVLLADLQSAHLYQQVFLENSAELIPETTTLEASTATLRALRLAGEAEFGYSNAYSVLELTTDRSKTPNYYSYFLSGKLKRVGDGKASVSVVVNDAPVDLPAIHAEGEFVGEKVEFLFLDDDANPLTLAFRIGIGALKPLVPEALKQCEGILKMGKAGAPYVGMMHCDHPNGGDADSLRVVKITYRCGVNAAAPVGPSNSGAGQPPSLPDGESADRLEQQLAAHRRVDIYSVYFAFNSDVIREESEPTLKDIAEVMRRHPDWALGVNGHTDAVGGDSYNLELSSRRAAAVKAALGERYGIARSRLTTAGFGRAQPKDTNETLEGRARNRRVELMRLD